MPLELDDLARSLGADFYGVADLGSARVAILEQGGPAVAEFPRAVSVGVALMKAIVDQLPQREQRAVAMNYRHHCYDIVNQRLDHITSRLGSQLQKEGYRAMPIPAGQTVDDQRILGAFSHKMAAHLAGLGWIGKSCLLVTPQVGPRVRWASVLTDAPLAPAEQATPESCGAFRQCVDACPVQAFSGEPFRPEDGREVRFAAQKCKDYFEQMRKETGQSVCGLCLYVCPYGRRG